MFLSINILSIYLWLQWSGWGEFFKIGAGGAEKVEPLFISKVCTFHKAEFTCRFQSCDSIQYVDKMACSCMWTP